MELFMGLKHFEEKRNNELEQISEGVRINEVAEGSLMNSKNERMKRLEERNVYRIYVYRTTAI